MKKTLLGSLALGVTMIATSPAAFAVDPEQDRQNLVDFFKSKSPKIAFEDYKDGGYIYSADKRAQWEAVEEFPPYLDSVDAGEELYQQDQAVYEKCFGDDPANVRPHYPYFDEKTQQVVTLEWAINICREDAGLKPFKYKKGDIAKLSAYFAYQSRGQKVDVKIDSDGAREAYNKGRDMFIKPVGQLGLSCAKCHAYNAGRYARADLLSPTLGHTTHFPVFRAKWQELGTLHRRYGGCHQNMRANPFKPQSEEYRNLEFFQAYISNGLEINGPGYRQ
ncbi:MULTISPECIES: sulfur oxidation c-type cytochrome SoxA [Thiomicrorhabdus]|uniref:SoxAX cytochrome complex subunit A n=1 Tax=Thiomicrorhabdus xiamenensis TaxID=2739063 RepID=A0A7D4NPZ4_9GAMM|nr:MULTISPECIES: sulfur oxidation c-type cytochrome SoxA [Thiomicrorhabdus]MBO1923617.1 sulfur oxidation c-type cytochrome SoxA [Thiomicrorhabdus sp. 6S3-12]QKI88751.1 sulfur oxidation c-type cytochrome SoxA [Thiomicrorhabdus xiamenensis]